MNWKKILVFAAAGALGGSLGHYGSEIQQGHHYAFTAGTILYPAVGSLITTLAALFAKPPQQ